MDIEKEVAERVAALKPMDIGSIITERKVHHGDFNDHADYTQRLKLVLHSAPNWLVLTNTQREGLEMIAHKIGRILAGDPSYPDHWLDIEGYARITRERL